MKSEPPFEIVDGRDERARALDAEVERRWNERCPPVRRFPSEIRRRSGIGLRRAFGLVQCPRLGGRCRRFLIVRNRQQMASCSGCGSRIWLAGLTVIAQSDSRERLGRVKAWIIGRRNAHPFIPLLGDLDGHAFGPLAQDDPGGWRGGSSPRGTAAGIASGVQRTGGNPEGERRGRPRRISRNSGTRDVWACLHEGGRRVEAPAEIMPKPRR
jgi:hypothetical protein